MNKKGIFVPTLVFITLIVLIYAYFTLTSEEIESRREGVIGDVQTKMIKQYQEGENILFYIDQAVKYSGYKTAGDLGENGGFYNYFPCGKAEDYVIWRVKGKCDPIENLEESFKNYFDKNLNEYFRSYPGVKIPTNNYEYILEILDEDYLDIKGLAKNSITTKVENEFEIEYSIFPSFKQKIKYSLHDYQKIMEEIKRTDIINTVDCLKNPPGDLKDCIWDIYNFDWEIKKEDNVVKFDVRKEYLFGPITIKFAINLEDFKVEE